MIKFDYLKGIRLLLCLLTISFVFSSCYKEVAFENQYESHQFVLNSLICPDDSIEIYLSKLNAILSANMEYDSNQTINLYENGELAWKGNEGINGKYITPIIPSVNKEYSIEIRDENEMLILVKDTVPEEVKITEASCKYPYYTDNHSTTYGKIILTFTDDPSKKNFYEVVILGENNNLIRTLKVSHPVVSYDIDRDPNPTGSLLFTDELFNGESLTLEIFSESREPTVVLKNTSKAYFEYRKSLINHRYNQNINRENIYDLFKGDPVELFSNVTNGLGIFAAYSQDIQPCTPINEQ